MSRCLTQHRSVKPGAKTENPKSKVKGQNAKVKSNAKCGRFPPSELLTFDLCILTFDFSSSRLALSEPSKPHPGRPLPARTESRASRLSTARPQRPCTPRCQKNVRHGLVGGSGQVTLRHMRRTAYGCFLPDLTRFAAPHCIGPDRQRPVPA